MEPLTPAVFHILLALSGEPRHGYGIMQEIAERTGGEMTMGPGTLYRTLQRMRDGGLLEECDPRGARDADERRRYYRLTRKGRDAAAAAAERLEKLVSAAYRKALIARPRLA